MRRTKANRALTFVMAAALLIGSIHGVGAKEQSKAYDAPELTLTQGVTDYDLTEGITYDSEKYTLSVTDTGNFDINVAGDYEISYALTEKAEDADQTPEGDDQTSDTDTTDQDKPADQDETDSAKDPIDSGNAGQTQGTSTGAGEAEDQGGGNADKADDQTSDTDTADQDKPDQPADEDEADSAKDPADSGNAGQTQGTSTGVGEAQGSENQNDGNTDTVKEESSDTDTVNITEEQTPKAANVTQEVINFSRTVKVVAAEEPVESYAVNEGIATYANVQGNYTVNLGTPVWTDDKHTKFQFTNVKIDTNGDDISLMTIDLSKVAMSQDILKDATFKSSDGKQATWIFTPSKNVEQLQQQIREMVFDYHVDEQIDIVINGNETKGLDGKAGDLLRWAVNGHYYLYFNEVTSWSKAYNKAMDYKLAGMQGYLATVVSHEEAGYLLNLSTDNSWVAVTRLVKSDGTLLNNDRIDPLASGTVRYRSNLHTNHNNSPDVMKARMDYYWAAGPEAGTNTVQWRDSAGVREPNELAAPVSDDNTLADVQSHESCGMLAYTNYGTGIYDYKEGNSSSGVKGYYVEFGGYADGADPGGVNNKKQGEVSENVAPKEAEAVVNYSDGKSVKYAFLADALNAAEEKDVIEIVKSTVTPVTDGILKKGVQLKSEGRVNVYTADVDSKLDVADNGTVTLKDGHIKVSDNGVTLKVESPIDNKTYQITTPQGATEVIVPDISGGDQTPYVMNHNTNVLDLKIDDVTYSYTNESWDNLTMVYIPDAMYQNERVTKAEVTADKSAVIKLDDGEENTVEIKGNGSATDKVTVERRTSDKKAEVKLPSGTKAKVFGHEVDTAPAGGVTVGQRNAVDTKYPDRDYIVIDVAGEKVTVDGIEYVATENKQKFYLGTFKAIVTIGSNVEITSGQEQTDVGYLKTYTVKVSPKADYDLDQDNFMVTMKESDTGTVKNLTFADVCSVDPADGSITVTIPNVSGDITVNTAAKRQMTTLKVTGLVAGNAKGSFKAVDASGHEYKLEQDGSINVNRNEELTLIFTPNDFSNPYYSDLTGEKGESFSILTALQETTNNKDLFSGAKTFNWKEKSYELKYTPTTSDVTLKAVFTPSHIVHVNVTGGTAEVKTTGLVTKESGVDQFQHVIVKNNGTVGLELKDTTGTATTHKKAYWSNVDGSDATDESNQVFTGNGTSYTYTTKAVGKPQALNITFEEGQTVDVKVTHGKLVTGNDGVVWNDNGNSTYQTIVKSNGALKVNIKPEDGYGLKSITVNNVAIDIDAAIKSGEITWDGTTKTYSHTFAKVYQAWNVTVDFEKLHEIVFEDQKGNILNKTERITVIDGDTIPAASFTKMQKEADKSKAENESLFVWVDKTDSTKIYNETTVMTAQTADVVTLIPVYRMNVIKGADGSVIAADDFVIHVNDVRKLTDTEAATLANVKAYDHSGSDISNRVTVEQTKLEELKKKTKGTYVDALTFMIAASGLTTGVEVEVTDDNPTITGKTAHTLTFKGRADETYKYQELDAQGTPTGNESIIVTDGDGKATITGLKKATPYKISHSKYGSVNGKTALVDAKDIAKQFEDRGASDTTGNNATDKTEKAENSNVQVVVDDDGNYKVIVKKDIDHTVEIPDTWGEVKIDLGGHTITGDKADDNNAAKPGLEFVKDGSTNEHPGTKLEIVNGTIKGGDGSAAHPDGAAGIGASGDTADAGLIIGSNANVIGGNGADGTEGKDGGNGGAGIDGNGKITPTVSGTVTGGNGGKGGDSAAGIPGNGGNGGTGISAGDKTITINPGGTVKGGDAGNGGNATGDNTNPGGNGGNGGTGTETTQPGKTDNNGGTTSGGNGGDGGKSDIGNGGNGGDGGSGSTGESNNNGGTNSGGNGGNGGDSDKGSGGSGGNGGSSGETGGNGGNNTGGNGGNGGDSNNGNGGNGGNGGESNSGNGGNGGDGGNGKNPGNGGNGGGSNSGNNGSSGSDGNRPGGNGGNNNGNGGNNGGNNGGSGSGDNSNGGNSNGNANGTNTGVTDGKTNATDIAAADGNNASGGNKNNKHNRNNRNNNESDQADGEDVTDGTETGADSTDADTGSDDTTDVADGTDTGADADDSIPADSSDADGHISFADCESHWYPIILILVIAGYTVLRIRKIREELDGE